jgi:hypothetical protein
MRNRGASARRQRRVGTPQEGDSPGHGGCRSSFLELPGRLFPRAQPKIGKGPWKLPEPWTPRTRPPLLGKPHRTRFPTATTGSVFFNW